MIYIHNGGRSKHNLLMGCFCVCVFIFTSADCTVPLAPGWVSRTLAINNDLPGALQNATIMKCPSTKLITMFLLPSTNVLYKNK